MKVLKQTVCLTLIVLFAVPLAGCWNNRPITQLAIVVGMGFDKAADGRILMSAEIMLPGKLGMQAGSANGGTNENASAIVTAEGDTGFDAARNLLARLNNKAYFAHVQLVVFGSELAKDGLDLVWDFMERDNEFSRTMKVLVVKGGTANSIFEAKGMLDKLNAVEIVSTLASNAAYGKCVSLPSFKISEMLSEPNTGIVTGLIDTLGNSSLDKMVIQGGAVFKRGKLDGYLDPDATRGYLFATGQIQSTILVVPNPEQKGKLLALEVVNSTGETNANMQNGRPVLSIQVHTTGNIGEEQGNGNLIDPKNIQTIENEAAQLIEKNIRSALYASQYRLRSDIFGFNQKLYKTQTAAYKKISGSWEEAYQNAACTVDVQFHLDRSGLIKEPAIKF